MELKVKIIDPIGLHARPAGFITREAAKYVSDIKILANGREANLKSILSVMSLNVKTNQDVTITAKGKDEEQAIENIEKIMKENKLI